MRALSIAATGMSAQEQNIEVIANNIANINTTGFKRSRAEFTDLIYQTERLMGVSSRGQDATVPEGAQIGLGVRTAAIRSVQIAGIAHKHRQCDGSGDQRPRLVPGDDARRRHRLHPRRLVQHQRDRPAGDFRRLCRFRRRFSFRRTRPAITVSQTGLVTATIPGQATPQSLGQMTIANFVNRGRTAGAGQQSVPADRGFGPAQCRRARRHVVRPDPAGLCRGLQRRSRYRKSPI